MSHGAPFVVHVCRENNYDTTLIVRFEVLDGGMGILGLRGGRDEETPRVAHEIAGIDVDSLRAGRFIHVVPGGTRQSYALARITKEFAEAIQENQWLTLAGVTEYGFRYLVPPEGWEEGESQAAVQLQPVKGSAVATSISAIADKISVPRPASVARASQVPEASREVAAPPAIPAADLPPRQVPVAPALAEKVLASLDLDGARSALRDEMAKVAALHDHVAKLQAALADSQARERDLLEVLSKWQRRS